MYVSTGAANPHLDVDSAARACACSNDAVVSWA
jgi:hypothetical protein